MEIPELKKFQSHRKIHVFHRGSMDINCNGSIINDFESMQKLCAWIINEWAESTERSSNVKTH